MEKAGRYYSERSYEKSRVLDERAAEAQSASRETQESAATSAATTDTEYDSNTDGSKVPLKKRGRAQTPYRELSESEAMELKTG